jgi:hypothetical protein
VHYHFSRPAAATHSDILNRSAKTGTFVSLKMRQRNKYVSIHHRSTDSRGLTIHPALNGNIDIVRSFQAVSDNVLATSRNKIETVFFGSIQMHNSIVTSSDVQSITVSQKRQTAEFLDFFDNSFDPLRTEIRQITGFAEMYLDSDVLTFEVDVPETGFGDDPLQFAQQRIAVLATHISPINF